MATDSAADVNRTYAVDGRWGFGQRWTSDFWAARTTTPGLTHDANALSARIAYQTNVWNHNARIAQVGDDFNPEVGFMSRPGGYRAYDVSLMRLVREPQWDWFKQWNPHVSYKGYTGLTDGFYQTGYLHLDLTEIELANSTKFGPEYTINNAEYDDDGDKFYEREAGLTLHGSNLLGRLVREKDSTDLR